MGLILDTSVVIVNERRGDSVGHILRQARTMHGEFDVALSAVSAVELTHGIYRARTVADRERRRLFCDEVFRDLILHPVTLDIAQLAGQIEDEQAAKGVSIAFEDLVIGATALHLGFDVATLNVKHFSVTPGLKIVTLTARKA
jgi:predicted nucleic acid-binding protein